MIKAKQCLIAVMWTKFFLKRKKNNQVTGDSLLIHEFAYSLFIGLCSVTTNMTGYSHSYHWIKLIYCGASQRDVLSDKMVLWVVTHIFHFVLCQSSLLSTVINFVYKDKWLFDESMSVIFCMENTWKEFFYSLSTLIPHWTKLGNFVMQLKRKSVGAWKNEKYYSKENNTSENPISRQDIFKSVDHVKCEGQVRSQHLLFVQFSRWSFKLSWLLTKTTINYRFFKSSLRWVDGLKKLQWYWVKELLLYNRM